MNMVGVNGGVVEVNGVEGNLSGVGVVEGVL